jgi:hypothetical protein
MLSHRNLLRLAVVILALAFPAAAHATSLGDGAWCWFADPRAVYHDGHTYVGSVTSTGDITVTDYKDGQSKTAVLHKSLDVDDHANPALQVLPDGRLAAYYSAHAGARMFYRIETRGSWGPEYWVPTNVPGRLGYTYPNPVHLDAEHATYLFWRGANYSPAYSVLPDDRSSWSPAKNVIDGDWPAGGRPYAKYATDGDATIAMAFTNAHPDENGDVNIYYAAYRDGELYHADGTVIGKMGDPIKPTAADLVYDGPSNAWVSDVALEPDGTPVIVFATVPGPTGHHYYYARWDDGWQIHDLSWAGGTIHTGDPLNQPSYSGGVTLDHETPGRVYLSRQTSTNAWQVIAKTTTDGGETWTTQALSDATSKNVRPVSPLGLKDFGGPMSVLWMHGDYQTFTNYDTEIVGINAPAAATSTRKVATVAAAPAPQPAPVTAQRMMLRVTAARWRHQRVQVRLHCLHAACDRLLAVHARHRVIARGRVRLGGDTTRWVRPPMLRHRHGRLRVYLR